jgi:hypothetical protein
MQNFSDKLTINDEKMRFVRRHIDELACQINGWIRDNKNKYQHIKWL